MYLRITAFMLLFMVITCNTGLYSQEKIIFDTDFDSDIDDVGALYMLHTFADRGEVEIMATILSTTHFWSPFALDAINTFWGRPDIPIGAPVIDGVNKGSVYAETIAKDFPNDLGEHMKIEDATLLYRRILASQADSSVTMVTIGHLTNVANLLTSEPDRWSPLSGKELVHKKVKRWVAMLGEGMNWNMKWDRKASATAINEFPVAVIQTVEGQEVRTGQRTQSLSDRNPIKTVYRLWKEQYGEIDRSSWDQISTLFAVKGENNYFRLNRGTLTFSSQEGARWETHENGKDFRLYNTISNEALAETIEELMIQTPVTASTLTHHAVVQKSYVLIRPETQGKKDTTHKVIHIDGIPFIQHPLWQPNDEKDQDSPAKHGEEVDVYLRSTMGNRWIEKQFNDLDIHAGEMYILGAINSLDKAHPPWGGGNSYRNFFIGDSVGILTLTYGSGRIDTIPFIFGYNVGWNHHYKISPEPFKSDPKAKKELDQALCVANALEGYNSSGDDYYIRIDLRDEKLESAAIYDHPKKIGYFRLDGITFGAVKESENLGIY
ncbi:MAG: hypothetical protein ABFS28_17335, partial [Bacteroidota bacterium]